MTAKGLRGIDSKAFTSAKDGLAAKLSEATGQAGSKYLT
jgi:hypothetical protein